MTFKQGDKVVIKKDKRSKNSPATVGTLMNRYSPWNEKRWHVKFPDKRYFNGKRSAIVSESDLCKASDKKCRKM